MLARVVGPGLSSLPEAPWIARKVCAREVKAHDDVVGLEG